VEVWERARRTGGQIHLAVAAPDKEEVRPVWSDRWQELERLKVVVQTGVDADTAMIRAFAPDHVLLATGSVPRKPPLPLEGLSPAVSVCHAWDLFEHPDRIAPGARVTIVGGGMVGAELADLLRLQDCSIRVLEMQSGAAAGMARNNRMELLERLAADGVEVVTDCRIDSVAGDLLHVRIAGAAPSQLPVGDWLVFATGPQPQLDVVAAVQDAGVPFTRIGDAQTPGDFLAAIRDGWMAALALDAEHQPQHQPAARAAQARSLA
jgi:pyruvate/2-oxoglutarate dehydrogenase complex dihydrolipoamide dehydrogenase (E3) component